MSSFRRPPAGACAGSSNRRFAARHDQGVALIVAIWVTALLSLIAFSFASSVRVHVKVAANLSALAEAEALADGGIERAAAQLIRRVRSGQREPLKSGREACVLPGGGGTLLVEVRDEGGKVDLNIANEALIRALVAGLFSDPGVATAVAEAILDYRDDDDDRRVAGAEERDYRAAGRTGPRNGPFQSVEELGNVLGLDRSMVKRLLPHATVRSGQDGVDSEAASPELAEILGRGRDVGPGARLKSQGSPFGDSGVPPEFRTLSAGKATFVRVTAMAPKGGVFAREAVIEVLPVRPPPPPPPAVDPERGTRARPSQPQQTVAYAPYVTEWRRSEVSDVAAVRSASGPPC